MTAPSNTLIKTSTTTPVALTGLLTGLQTGPTQSWGALTMLSLFHDGAPGAREGYVPPLANIKLVQVPTYGTVVLHNTATQGVLIVPMHIGFFQPGAQNHATSRVLILGPAEVYRAEDCFCIQQSQGGLLKEAQQRFIVLPLGLRGQALKNRNEAGFARLWDSIDAYTRRFGVARGGHLERVLRPYFARLQVYRHTIEPLPGQIGAAYFIAGRLAGIEVAPNPAYWEDLQPILSIYCYGLAAILAEQQQWATPRVPLDLAGVTDLPGLATRLADDRACEAHAHTALLEQLTGVAWEQEIEGEQHGVQAVTMSHDAWQGQYVRSDAGLLYLSLFRDVEKTSAPVF